MTPQEVEKILIELRRACPGFAGWTSDELSVLAIQNGTSIEEETDAFLAIWDDILGPTDFASARIVIRRLATGHLACPPFGQLRTLLRSESQIVTSARRQSELHQRQIEARQQREEKSASRPEGLTGGGEKQSVVEMLAALDRSDLVVDFERARAERAAAKAKELQPKTPRVRQVRQGRSRAHQGVPVASNRGGRGDCRTSIGPERFCRRRTRQAGRGGIVKLRRCYWRSWSVAGRSCSAWRWWWNASSPGGFPANQFRVRTNDSSSSRPTSITCRRRRCLARKRRDGFLFSDWEQTQ